MPARIIVKTPYGKADIDVFRANLKHAGKGTCLCANIYCHDEREGVPDNQRTRKFSVILPLSNLKSEVLAAFDNSVGFSWSSIKAVVSKTIKSVGTSRLLSAATDIAQKAATYGSAIYPPLGVTYNAISKASKLLSDAKAGKRHALKKIKAIRKEAEAGNLAAAQASKVLMVLNKIGNRVNIDRWITENKFSGWVAHKPYRSRTDSTDPRSYYAAGLV